MAQLTPRKYRIRSFLDGNPPTAVRAVPLPIQDVVLNEVEQVWTLTTVGEPNDQVFSFSLEGYPATIVDGNRVNAAVDGQGENVNWHVTYHQRYRAYNIEINEARENGWAVQELVGGNNPIVIEKLFVLSDQLPAFDPKQLFKFEPVD